MDSLIATAYALGVTAVIAVGLALCLDWQERRARRAAAERRRSTRPPARPPVSSRGERAA